MESTTVYDKTFYEGQRDKSLQSARAIVPLLLSSIPIHSVVDIGCGVGTWLKAFQENGITEIAGFDGKYVDTSTLEIDPANFEALDLCTEYALSRKFDLAISLEVAEHLPPKDGAHLVKQLASVAPLVLFSAAIPGQGGTNHLNEQWQDYWRSKFNEFGYHPADVIRPLIWGRKDIDMWYQQNIILYYKEGHLPVNDLVRPVSSDVSLNLVHPDCYLASQLYFSKAAKLLPSLAWRAISKRISKAQDQS